MTLDSRKKIRTLGQLAAAFCAGQAQFVSQQFSMLGPAIWGSPMLRLAAIASLVHRDGNGLLDRLGLCRRMAGADRSILLPVFHERFDVAAND